MFCHDGSFLDGRTAKKIKTPNIIYEAILHMYDANVVDSLMLYATSASVKNNIALRQIGRKNKGTPASLMRRVIIERNGMEANSSMNKSRMKGRGALIPLIIELITLMKRNTNI